MTLHPKFEPWRPSIFLSIPLYTYLLTYFAFWFTLLILVSLIFLNEIENSLIKSLSPMTLHLKLKPWPPLIFLFIFFYYLQPLTWILVHFTNTRFFNPSKKELKVIWCKSPSPMTLHPQFAHWAASIFLFIPHSSTYNRYLESSFTSSYHILLCLSFGVVPYILLLTARNGSSSYTILAIWPSSCKFR